MRKTLLRLAVLALMGGTTLSFVSCNKDFEEDLQQLRDDVTTQMNKQHQDLMDAIKQSEQSMKDYADAAAKAAKDYADNIAASEAAAAKAEAIAEANGYTDAQIKEALDKAMKSVNEAIAKALKDAQAYADSAAKEAAEKAKLELLVTMEQKCAEVLADANKYTDDQLAIFKKDLDKVLEGKFNEIEGEIDALNEYVKDLKAEFDKLNIDYTKFKENTQNSIKSINEKLDDIKIRLDGIDADIDGIREDISDINVKLSTLETTLENQIERIDDLIDAINRTLADHGRDIKALQDAIADIRVEMVNLENELKNMVNTEINKLRGEMEDLVEETIDNLEAAIKAAKEDAIKNANNYTDEQKAILDKSISKLQGQLDALKKAYEKFAADTEADIDEIFSQLSDVQLNISAIQTLLDGYGVRIENLESAVAKMRKDFGAALKSLEEKLQGNIDALQQEMADQLKEIVAWLEDLQVSSQTNSQLITELFAMILDLESQHYMDMEDLKADIDNRFDGVYAHIDEVKDALKIEIAEMKEALEAQIKEYYENAKNYTDEQIALIKVITDNLQQQLDNANALLKELDEYRTESKQKFETISANILEIEQVLTYVVNLAEANQIRIGIVETELTDLTAHIDEVEALLRVDMDHMKEAIEENMAATLAALEDLRITMGMQLDAEVKAIKDLLATYATIDTVNATVQDLRNDVEEAFVYLINYTDKKVAELKEAMIQRMTQLGVDLGRAIGEASKEAENNAKKYTDQQIAEIMKLIDAMSGIGTQVQDLQNQANQSTADIDQLYTQYAALAQKMLALETINSTLESYGIRLKSLEDSLETLDAIVRQNGLSIAELTARVDDLFAQMDDVLTTIAALKARIDALEQAGQSGADLSGVMAALDKVDAILSQRLTSMTFIPEFYDKATNTPVIPFKSTRYYAAEYNFFTDKVTRAKEPTIIPEGTTSLRFNVAPSNVTRDGIEKIEFIDNEITLMAAGAQQEGFLKAIDWTINANNELEVSVERNAKVNAATGKKKTTVAMKAFIAQNLLTANELEAFVVSDYVPVVEQNLDLSLGDNPMNNFDYNLENSLALVKDPNYVPVSVAAYSNNEKFTLSSVSVAALFNNTENNKISVFPGNDTRLKKKGFSIQFGICSESASDLKNLQVFADGSTQFKILNPATRVFYLYVALVDNATGNNADIKFFAVEPIGTL